MYVVVLYNFKTFSISQLCYITSLDPHSSIFIWQLTFFILHMRELKWISEALFAIVLVTRSLRLGSKSRYSLPPPPQPAPPLQLQKIKQCWDTRHSHVTNQWRHTISEGFLMYKVVWLGKLNLDRKKWAKESLTLRLTLYLNFWSLLYPNRIISVYRYLYMLLNTFSFQDYQ